MGQTSGGALVRKFERALVLATTALFSAAAPDSNAHFNPPTKLTVTPTARCVLDTTACCTRDDVPYQWVKKHEEAACHPDPLHSEAKAILAAHGDLIEKHGTSQKELADPYVIALAKKSP